MHRFPVVIEKAGKNYSAYSPDLPGCIVTGKNREELKEQMHEAIVVHNRGFIEDGMPVPKSYSSFEFISGPIFHAPIITSRAGMPENLKRV
ncbi:MAG: type II toxin-antitoxin system HicB family antitoxin [Methanoregula sp.]